MIVLVAIVLFVAFRYVFFKNADTPSPVLKSASGSTGANGNAQETDTISPELRLNRPRSVNKPEAPPFKSINLKNP
mgnify:FL=1